MMGGESLSCYKENMGDGIYHGSYLWKIESATNPTPWYKHPHLCTQLIHLDSFTQHADVFTHVDKLKYAAFAYMNIVIQ